MCINRHLRTNTISSIGVALLIVTLLMTEIEACIPHNLNFNENTEICLSCKQYKQIPKDAQKKKNIARSGQEV